jgi:hypothetical protein
MDHRWLRWRRDRYDRPTVSATQRTLRSQLAQVAPNGHFADVEAAAQLGNSGLPVVPNRLYDQLLTFFLQWQGHIISPELGVFEIKNTFIISYLIIFVNAIDHIQSSIKDIGQSSRDSYVLDKPIQTERIRTTTRYLPEGIHP